MSVRRRAQDAAGLLPIVARQRLSLGRRPAIGRKRRAFGVLMASSLLVYAPCRADVPVPPAPPPVPAGYCSSIYTELSADLLAFNAILAIPPTTWKPIPGGPTLYAGNLQWANGNTGPSMSNPNYLQTTIQPQLQELKALGVQAILVPVLFPILYEPFYGSQTAYQPYLTLYTGIAQAVRAAGLKLIVDNEILFSNDIAAGWTNMNAFYGPLTWTEYTAARAQMAATIEQYMQPDYLMLANEPDTEAAQTGQQSLKNPADAAQMVQAEITAVQNYLQTATVSPIPKLGAGFGSWMAVAGSSSLVDYIDAYTALPLDYIDFHMLPIGTVNRSNFLEDTLTIASMAAAAGKPVAISQAWMLKETAAEVSSLSVDVVRARAPFSFWAPLDDYFLQTAENLANYTNLLYLAPYNSTYLAAYQTYGGTAANGGDANCTCTTASCSDYDIMQTENSLAGAADQQSVYTAGAVSYYNQVVTKPDTTPPTAPANLTGTPSYTSARLSWSGSTDDIGVAGYNVYRCTAPAAGQSCTGVWIANTTLPSYNDSSLTSNTYYNYQVQAFDFANNNSPLSPTLSLLTYRTTADAATNLVATPVSAQEIELSWSPPSDATGLGQYLVFGGTSAANLQQIAVRSSTMTTYKDYLLSPGTTYYYGIVAVEEGIDAAMSNVASAATLPLPNPPSNVTGAPTATEVVLTWQETLPPNGLPVSFYKIFQGSTPGNMSEVGSTTLTIYTAKSLSPSTTYYFEVVAGDTGHDESAPSGQIAVTTSPLPAAPVNIVATPNSSTVLLAWSENIPPNGLPIAVYNIFRGTSPTGLTELTSRTASPYFDSSVSPGATYYYAIQAVDTGHDVSPMSPPVQVATPAVPAAPANVVATANSSTIVTVTWTENVPPDGLPIQYYNIFRGTAPTGLAQVAARAASPFYDIVVSPGTTYYYEIEAVDTVQDVSPMSPTAQVTTP